MPRPDMSEERKAQILDAATSVFARHGLSDARMDDIARESGVSKGGLYLYYKSKDALIAALLRRFFTLEMRGVRAVIDGKGTVSERLFAMTEMFAADLDRLSLVMPLTLEFYAIAGRQREVRQFLNEMLAEYRAALSRAIQSGVASGEFRPVAASEVALTIIALYEGLLVLWIVDPKGISWREVAPAALRVILTGMAPQSGDDAPIRPA
jgi:AcrR family transcriptional regulator